MSVDVSGIAEKLLAVLKLIVGIALLPLLYTSSVAFVNQMGHIQKSFQNFFWLGSLVFLIFFLFIWEPEVLYTGGQRLLEMIFSFFQPFARIAPFLLPIYTIILFMAYGLVSLGISESWFLEYCMLLAGFTIVMHIVFTARALGTQNDDFLKANYVLRFSLVYIINVMLLALLLGLVFKQFSSLEFFKGSFLSAREIVTALFKQIFVR